MILASLAMSAGAMYLSYCADSNLRRSQEYLRRANENLDRAHQTLRKPP